MGYKPLQWNVAWRWSQWQLPDIHKSMAETHMMLVLLLTQISFTWGVRQTEGYDPEAEDKEVLLEIKCPNVVSVTEWAYLVINSNGNLCLKQNHEYYYQVMWQLGLTGAPCCDLFCLYKQWFSLWMPCFRRTFIFRNAWQNTAFISTSFYQIKYQNPLYINNDNESMKWNHEVHSCATLILSRIYTYIRPNNI